MNRLLLATIILALSSPGIHAQNYNPKFDKAPDLTEFLKAAAEEPALQTCMPLPLIELEALKTGLIKKGVVLDLGKEFKAGYVAGGPHHLIVVNSRPFQDAILLPSLIGQHDSQPAYALLARWNDISSDRNGLLNDAGLLNAEDSGLYEVGVQIDNAAAAFAKEKAALEAEIVRYNKKCGGQPANYDCTIWYNDLVGRIAGYNSRVDKHNQRVKTWRIDVQKLKDLVAGWHNKVLEWETVILDFIEDAKAFLANPNTGTCPPPPAPPTPVIDYVPPGTPHFPCKGNHEHYFVYHQGPPPECKLRLKRNLRCLDKSNLELPLLDNGSNNTFPGFRQPGF